MSAVCKSSLFQASETHLSTYTRCLVVRQESSSSKTAGLKLPISFLFSSVNTQTGTHTRNLNLHQYLHKALYVHIPEQIPTTAHLPQLFTVTSCYCPSISSKLPFVFNICSEFLPLNNWGSPLGTWLLLHFSNGGYSDIWISQWVGTPCPSWPFPNCFPLASCKQTNLILWDSPLSVSTSFLSLWSFPSPIFALFFRFVNAYCFSPLQALPPFLVISTLLNIRDTYFCEHIISDLFYFASATKPMTRPWTGSWLIIAPTPKPLNHTSDNTFLYPVCFLFATSITTTNLAP